MIDLRTKEEKRKAEAEYRRWSKGLEDAKRRRAVLAKKIWGKLPWQKITSCPFKDYEHEKIFVTDGKTVALAHITKRFGTPMRRIKEPDIVMTVDGIRFVNGKFEKIKAPNWWFKWEFEDVDGMMTYAGGHETGKEEIDFIPTHWLPLLPKEGM